MLSMSEHKRSRSWASAVSRWRSKSLAVVMCWASCPISSLAGGRGTGDSPAANRSALLASWRTRPTIPEVKSVVARRLPTRPSPSIPSKTIRTRDRALCSWAERSSSRRTSSAFIESSDWRTSALADEAATRTSSGSVAGQTPAARLASRIASSETRR
jgi:hypothetical protein